jgi:hypothetical protein
MDTPTTRRLRREWQVLGTAPPSRTAYLRLADSEPAIARLDADDLAGLVAALSPAAGRLTRNEAATVIAAMLARAGTDELVPRAIVQALLPGVLALVKRFDISEGPWQDVDGFLSDAISCLWEQITVWTGTVRPYAAGDLLSATRTRLRTLQTTERRHRSRRGTAPEGMDVFRAGGDRSGEELLAHALAEATGDGLAAADAAVLYATSVLGLTMAELSELAGEPVSQLRRQRRSAITQLVA